MLDHEHTDQEQAIWDHLEAGEHDDIEQLRTDAASAPGEVSASDQFNTDYANAWAHYQEENEMSEKDREKNTKDQAAEDNQASKDKEPKPKQQEADEDG